MNQTTASDGTGTTPPQNANDVVVGLESKTASAKDRLASEAARLKDEAAKLKDKAGVKATEYADAGKGKASDALESLSGLLRDAAGTVDQKLGENYGQYARKTADVISGAATSLRDKDLTTLADDAKEFVRKSPVVAIGVAAAAGFVLARLLKSGGSSDRTDSDA